MSDKANCTVYIGNLDERVSHRVLYDILIQAGRVVDLYIPRDRESDRPKGYAFAEYESEEIADYAVRLFSGLVTIYNRTLKFAISGRDKPSQNVSTTATPASNGYHQPRPYPVRNGNADVSQHPVSLSSSCRVSSYASNSSTVPAPPGVTHPSKGYGSHFNGNNYENSRRVFGSTMDSISRSRSRRFDTRNPILYHPY